MPDDTLTHAATGQAASPSPTDPRAVTEDGGSAQDPGSPQLGGQQPPSGSVPADLIDLTRWYLTLPVARDGDDSQHPKARNVYQQDADEGGLLTFHDPHHFHVTGDAVEYVAPVEGATTSSASGATRSELREMTGPTRDDKARWTLGEDTRHVLTCTLTCDPSSITGTGTGDHRPRRECIVGQIHNDADTPPLYLAFKMKDDDSAFLELDLDHDFDHDHGHDQDPDHDHAKPRLLTGLRTDTRFTYRIEADGDTCRVWAAVGDDWQADGDPTVIDVDRFVTKDECYFKAGAYNMTKIKKNDHDGTNTGESVVRHYRLDIG